MGEWLITQFSQVNDHLGVAAREYKQVKESRQYQQLEERGSSCIGHSAADEANRNGLVDLSPDPPGEKDSCVKLGNDVQLLGFQGVSGLAVNINTPLLQVRDDSPGKGIAPSEHEFHQFYAQDEILTCPDTCAR